MALHHPERLDMVVLLDGACYTSGTYGKEMFDLVSINPPTGSKSTSVPFVHRRLTRKGLTRSRSTFAATHQRWP